LKRIEPEDNEYNYNLLVNSAMKMVMAMSDEQFDRYFYDLMMQKARGKGGEPQRLKFSNQDWIHPSAIALVSLTLMKIMSQIKF